MAACLLLRDRLKSRVKISKNQNYQKVISKIELKIRNLKIKEMKKEKGFKKYWRCGTQLSRKPNSLINWNVKEDFQERLISKMD